MNIYFTVIVSYNLFIESNIHSLKTSKLITNIIIFKQLKKKLSFANILSQQLNFQNEWLHMQQLKLFLKHLAL